MIGTHGTGYRPDPVGHRYNLFRAVHPAAKMRGGSPKFPNGPIELAPDVWNQDGTSSCGGHGAACALTILLRAAGKVTPSCVSPLACYRMARMIDRAAWNPTGDLPPLQDDGVQPNQLARGLVEFGLQFESEMPGSKTAADSDYMDWLSANINTEPKLGDFLASDANQVLIDWTEILDNDVEKPALVAASIQSGAPVTVAIDASTASFQGYSGGGVLVLEQGQPNHLVCLLGVRPANNGTRELEYLLQNSWGPWGDGGRAWINQQSVRNATYNALAPRLI